MGSPKIAHAATVAAWAIFGEPIGLVQVAGGAIVLAGIWVSKKGS